MQFGNLWFEIVAKGGAVQVAVQGKVMGVETTASPDECRALARVLAQQADEIDQAKET